jgi:hypothetical protein
VPRVRPRCLTLRVHACVRSERQLPKIMDLPVFRCGVANRVAGALLRVCLLEDDRGGDQRCPAKGDDGRTPPFRHRGRHRADQIVQRRYRKHVPGRVSTPSQARQASECTGDPRTPRLVTSPQDDRKTWPDSRHRHPIKMKTITDSNIMTVLPGPSCSRTLGYSRSTPGATHRSKPAPTAHRALPADTATGRHRISVGHNVSPGPQVGEPCRPFDLRSNAPRI